MGGRSGHDAGSGFGAPGDNGRLVGVIRGDRPGSTWALRCSVSTTRLTTATRLFFAVMIAGALAGAAVLYFAFVPQFGYPDEAPVPGGATVLVTDAGWDDDDPMRSRHQVIDINDGSPSSLLDFYREAYPASAGWAPVRAGREQELCLVDRGDHRYTEVLEVFPYRGTRVEQGRGRYLVMISRLEPGFGNAPCDEATSWVASDLLSPTHFPPLPPLPSSAS